MGGEELLKILGDWGTGPAAQAKCPGYGLPETAGGSRHPAADAPGPDSCPGPGYRERLIGSGPVCR